MISFIIGYKSHGILLNLFRVSHGIDIQISVSTLYNEMPSLF